MKKTLIAEAVVLLVLVLVAVVIRVNVPDNTATPQTSETVQQSPNDDTEENTQQTTETQTMTQEVTEEVTEVFNPEPSATETEYVDPRGLTARNYFVYDCNTMRFLAINADENARIYPASVTKLFTAFVALQHVQPDTVITAGDELSLIAEDSSIAYIQKNQKLTAAMLVEGMLLPSGNDAAYILAAGTAREASGNPDMSATDAIAYFVRLMNATAKSVGLTASNFCNPDGYHDDNHYTSSHDLTIIARLALGNKTISGFTSLLSANVRYVSGETNSWQNTNALINPGSSFYRKSAIGLKTGFTDEAGNCLLSAFRDNGRTLVVGVFGCPEKSARFREAVQLYDEFA